MKREPFIYPRPGYFCEPVYAWWPNWTPKADMGKSDTARREAAARGRQTALSNGHTGAVLGGLSAKSERVTPDAKKARIS